MANRYINDARFVIRDMSKSLSLNGTSDVLECTTMGNFGSGLASGFSFTCWFKSKSTTQQRLCGVTNTGTATNLQVLTNTNSAMAASVGRIGISYRDNDGNNLYAATTNALPINNGQWHHLVLTASGPTNTSTIYIDGISQAVSYGNQQTPDNFSNFGYTMMVGGYNNRGTAAGFFTGLLDDVEFYNKILTPSEVSAIYLRDANASSLVAKYSMNDVVTDSSGNGYNGTLTGGAYSTDVVMKPRTAVSTRLLNKSLGFNKVNDSATTNIVPLDTGFSFGFWLWLDTLGLSQRILANNNGAYSQGFYLTTDGAVSGRLQFATNGSPAAVLQYDGLVARTWTHVVVTFVANSAKMYINGSTSAFPIGMDTSCAYIDPSTTMQIGRNAESAANFFGGYIDELVWQNTTTPWTQQQITDLYNGKAFPAGASHWNFNDNVTDQSGNGATITLTNTTYSYEVPRKVVRTAI